LKKMVKKSNKAKDVKKAGEEKKKAKLKKEGKKVEEGKKKAKLKKEGKKVEEGKKIEIEKIKFHEKRDISDILRLRKKKPRFMRQELPKLKRLKDKWRRPRGIDSKKREGKRGKGKLPKIGYKKPAIVRGIHPSGFYPVLVHNVEELTLINPEEEAAIIARAIGRRKRNEIIRSANELNITILNPRKGEL